MDKYLLITFNSTNFAMQAESVLKELDIDGQIVPTPREITLSCGLSIRTSMENLEKVQNLIKLGKITNKSLYVFEGVGKDRAIKEI
ncbi:DUF3343 domain-containing protein [Fonticella tunisiensis]|uniref:Uncharacterized protein DUF3343 n=1 Tax=Fonticella tunisiensis TaxID=1096341 RepID=A0A4R7KCQ9_9CLOT|nr:DUF3343 domain-containing protein [Fonticella tunisiensis]TDT50476.1 uncharacterized protein DUF3343 [Fonticella tunisiensis]